MNEKNECEVKESYFSRNEEGKNLNQKVTNRFNKYGKREKLCYTKEETKLARWCSVILVTTKEE